jgi:NADH-ubiquinone oxidoreductase chain 2
MLITFLILLLTSNGLTEIKDSSMSYSRTGLVILSLSYFYCYNSFYIEYIKDGILLYGGLFNVMPVTGVFEMFILLVSSLILSISGFFSRKSVDRISTYAINSNHNTLGLETKSEILTNKNSEVNNTIEYTLIIIFVISGACLLINAKDLTSMYLCLELQSFSIYIISSIYRNSESATGSALTYFLLGGLSSCFILLGIGLIYANSGLTNLDNIYFATNDLSDFSNMNVFDKQYFHIYMTYSLLLISVGFLFKIAAAPFH